MTPKSRAISTLMILWYLMISCLDLCIYQTPYKPFAEFKNSYLIFFSILFQEIRDRESQFLMGILNI